MKSYRSQMAEAEEKILREALAVSGSISATARSLEIHRNTLQRKLIILGVTQGDLYSYRQKQDLSKFGTGWSGIRSHKRFWEAKK